VQLTELPDFSLPDMNGTVITRESLLGKVVLIEFRATWCPPYRGTLKWLGEVQERFGEDVAVVAIAIQSDAERVRKIVGEHACPVRDGVVRVVRDHFGAWSSGFQNWGSTAQSS